MLLLLLQLFLLLFQPLACQFDKVTVEYPDKVNNPVALVQVVDTPCVEIGQQLGLRDFGWGFGSWARTRDFVKNPQVILLDRRQLWLVFQGAGSVTKFTLDFQEGLYFAPPLERPLQRRFQFFSTTLSASMR